MKINGAKRILNKEESLKLDLITNQSIRTINFKNKLVKFSNILKDLKKTK